MIQVLSILIKNYFFKIKPEAGISYSLLNTIFYSNLVSNILYKTNEQYISLGTNLGFIVNSFENVKFGSSFSYDKYNKEFENRIFEIFSTYKIDRNLALNLNYKNNNLEKNKTFLNLEFLLLLRFIDIIWTSINCMKYHNTIFFE